MKMSYKQVPLPAASLCTQAYIQPTRKLSVLQQTALSLPVLRSVIRLPKRYFSHLKSLVGLMAEEHVFMSQKLSRLLAVLPLNGAEAEEFNLFLLYSH